MRTFGIVVFVFAASACSEQPAVKASDGALPADGSEIDNGSAEDQGADRGIEQDLPASGDLAIDTVTLPPCPAQSLAPGNHDLTIQHGGLSRSAVLHVPTGYANDKHLPLVLNFHGLTGTPKNQANNSKMEVKADQEGFIAVHPAGYGKSWNGGMCCPPASTEKIDDVGFVRALVEEVKQKVCVDPKRIYATGMSNGGLMTYRLSCEAADLFAAIAPVAAQLTVTSCSPSRPVPIIHFHGTEDGKSDYAKAVSTIEGWVTRNGCSDPAPTETYNKGAVHCDTYKQCNGGVEVTLCTVEGGPHCWPGAMFCLSGTATKDIIATDEMWTFFKRFALP